jgi:ligand-binding SRPBCC domain-containing protein
MARHLEFADWVPFPVAHVFAFFSNPENLPRIMPAETHTQIDELRLVSPPSSANTYASPQTAGIGTVIVTSFRMFPFLPFRAQWIARITEFEWDHHFADVQDKGPFKSWHHRHEFLTDRRDAISGTLVRDVIDYEIGFGPLGAVGNALFVERQMRGLFAQRQRVLPQLLG